MALPVMPQLKFPAVLTKLAQLLQSRVQLLSRLSRFKRRRCWPNVALSLLSGSAPIYRMAMPIITPCCNVTDRIWRVTRWRPSRPSSVSGINKGGHVVDELAIGVDIGGTKIAFALVNRDGQVLATHR